MLDLGYPWGTNCVPLTVKYVCTRNLFYPWGTNCVVLTVQSDPLLLLSILLSSSCKEKEVKHVVFTSTIINWCFDKVITWSSGVFHFEFVS
jgi:hypothetical protein